MKNRLGFFALVLALPLSVSCQDNSLPSPVRLDMGSLAYYSPDSSDSKLEAYTEIAYSKLSTLVSIEKTNFVFLVRGSTDTCACWQDFLSSCLGPYVHAKHLLVYGMSLETLEKGGDTFGLPLYAGYDTIGIFENGKLAYAKSYAEESKFGTDGPTFNAWMNERIIAPKIFKINESQLIALYEGKDPYGKATSRFALYFGRDTCPDCSFISRTDFRDYFAQRESASLPLYYFDADIWLGSDDYQKKKETYGLSIATSVFAYEFGAFPTLMSVIPSAGEKISTIDQIGVFYNDRIENGVITDSYFSQDRCDDPVTGINGALSYASTVEPHVLTGLSVSGEDKNEALRPYHQPLVYALLDEIL